MYFRIQCTTDFIFHKWSCQWNVHCSYKQKTRFSYANAANMYDTSFLHKKGGKPERQLTVTQPKHHVKRLQKNTRSILAQSRASEIYIPQTCIWQNKKPVCWKAASVELDSLFHTAKHRASLVVIGQYQTHFHCLARKWQPEENQHVNICNEQT